MNVKKSAGLHSFLTKAKEDKKFYSKHKREIDRYIRLIDKEFEAIDAKQKSKFNFKAIKAYVPNIIHLFNEFINSS